MKQTKLRPLVGLLALVALFLIWAAFNWQALQSLHQRWIHFDEPYAVGYPAVLLSLWWLLRHWSALRLRCAAPSAIALAAVLGILIFGVAARLVQLMLLQQIVALCSIWLIAVAVLGWSAGRLLIFPCALLALGIPVWDFLVDPMRAMTVWFTQHMLDFLVIPAHIDGFRIHLPAGIIEVAGGCSGLNLFLAMILIGLLFAESHRLSRERRALIVLTAALVGILDNWVRVFSLVVIAHRSQMQSDLVYHHGSFGWWIFIVGLLPYFRLAAWIEHIGKPDVGGHPQSLSSTTLRPLPWSRMMGSVLIIMVMMVALEGAAHALEERRGHAEHGFATPSGAMPVSTTMVWLPQYTGQDLTQAWRIAANGENYELVALTYLEQRTDKKLIYFSNRIADEDSVREVGRIEVAPGFSVNTAVIYQQGWRQVWWFWWVDGRESTGALTTKLLQLRAMLFGDPSSALIALSMRCEASGCRAMQPSILSELHQLQRRHDKN